MLLEADKIYQGTSQINPGTGRGVAIDTPLISNVLEFVKINCTFDGY